MGSFLSRPTINRVILDLLDQEHRNHRGSAIREDRSYDPENPGSLSLGAEGLALDSMELLTAAGVVNEFFHLHESGVEDYLLRRRRIDEWSEIVEHALREGVSGVTFRTSGSSGSPKLVTHGWNTLLQEIEFLSQLLTCRKRIVSTVPAHHIYGFLFTALLPEKLAIPVLTLPWERLGELPDRLEHRDLVISHPAIWHYLQRSTPDWPSSIWGVSSTAPLPTDLHEKLCSDGIDRLVEVYGSTETGGVGFRERPGEPFTLFPYYRRGAGEADLERDLPGKVSPEAVELMDQLEWQDRRRFLPVGRKDRVVQVGGENVHLTRVETVIREHPDVEEAAVRLNLSGPEGRLKAFVVPAAGSQIEADALKAHCKERLRPVEQPGSYTFGRELPRNPLGKLADWPV